jgi:hypothetical protein
MIGKPRTNSSLLPSENQVNMVASARDQAVWGHFNEYDDPTFKGRRVKCLHCEKTFGANTTTQKEHLVTCQKYIDHMTSTNQTSHVLQKALNIKATAQASPEKREIPTNSTLPATKKKLIEPIGGHLLITPQGWSRRIESHYWGHFKNNEDLYQGLIFGLPKPEDPCHPCYLPAVPADLATNLLQIPEKSVADILLYSYFVGVYPIVPLGGSRNFRTAYDKFWEWCQDSARNIPHDALKKDPTFLCLLWAVLYSGAVAASPSFWAHSQLRGKNRTDLINQFLKALDHSLALWDVEKRDPTHNIMTALSLRDICYHKQRESIERITTVSKLVRLGQSMGLQYPSTNSEDYWDRRYLWWYITWLDVEAAKFHGIPACYGEIHPSFDDEFVAELQDEELKNISTGTLLSICRFQAARIENFIQQNSRSRYSKQSDFEFAAEQIRRLQQSIGRFIAKIPAKGVPEEGFIPTRLSNASPLVDKDLFKEYNGSEATVFGCWARIMLMMIKNQLDISLNKALLDRTPSDNLALYDEAWEKLVKPCTTYLRGWLQLVRTPSFAPYTWFCPRNFLPLQQTMTLLMYLRYLRDSERPEVQLAQLASFLVEEVLDVLTGKGMIEYSSEALGVSISQDHQLASALRLFTSLRAGLDKSGTSMNTEVGTPMDTSLY